MSATATTSNFSDAYQGVNHPLPINLRDRFGSRYRIEYDPAYVAEYGANARADDPWLQIIPGRHGHIFPFGDDMLAVSTNFRRRIAKRLIGLSFCRVWQDGDGKDGVTVIFPADQFRAVAKIIGARTTRRLSAGRRDALIGAGKDYRFAKRRMQTTVLA